jgi:large subunit ribosomal protein L5
MNVMQNIKIEKLTLNIGAGKDANMLKKAVKLLKHITGLDPVHTITQKRLAAWGLRPGLAIGAKITIRNKEQIMNLGKRLFMARDSKVKEEWFDNHGNVSFGIHEYVDIPEVKYDTELGILGLQVSMTLSRPGYRVKRRKIEKTKIGKRQLIQKEEAMKYILDTFGLKMEEN